MLWIIDILTVLSVIVALIFFFFLLKESDNFSTMLEKICDKNKKK